MKTSLINMQDMVQVNANQGSKNTDHISTVNNKALLVKKNVDKITHEVSEKVNQFAGKIPKVPKGLGLGAGALVGLAGLAYAGLNSLFTGKRFQCVCSYGRHMYSKNQSVYNYVWDFNFVGILVFSVLIWIVSKSVRNFKKDNFKIQEFFFIFWVNILLFRTHTNKIKTTQTVNTIRIRAWLV